MTLPDGKSNKDRVQGYVGPIYIADAALYLMKHNPELGITDPYELTQPQFDAAVELLKGQRQIAPKYWGDYLGQIEDFKTEGFVAAPSWPLQVNLLVADGQPIASTIPEEGATGWADTTMMAVQGAASQLRLSLARALHRPQGPGRCGLLVRFESLRSRRLQGQRIAGRRRLQGQRLRPVRPDPFLEDADRRLRQRAERLRDLRQVG